jgi:putative acetyltransferase
MSDELEIRESVQGDAGAIEALYPEAFPEENLLPVVRDLLRDAAVTTSLVGAVDSRIVGHVIFTKCAVIGSDVSAALLGPLAVASAWQKQGIGSAIVRAGLRRLEDMDVNLVFVLGDPAYYGRLGFRPESLVEPPFRLPAEWDGAWQSRNVSGVMTPCSGELSVPRQWLEPALWAP